MKELKLYVWTGFNPDYTDGLAFAIAETEIEARRLVEKSLDMDGYSVWNWGKLEVLEISECARYVNGGG